MRLLVGHADQLGELLLRQPEHDAALADARPDMVVQPPPFDRPLLGFAIIHLPYRSQKARSGNPRFLAFAAAPLPR